MNNRTWILTLLLLLGGLLPGVVQGQNFRIFADSVQGNQGTQVIVPVRAVDFVNLIGAQGTVTWNTSVAAFDTVFQFGLPSMSPANFGTAQVGAGRLTFSWDDPGLSGVTLADSAVLFAIRFDVVGNPGNASPVSFSSNPTVLEFTNSSFAVIPYSTNNGQVAVSIGTSCLVADLTAGQQFACNPGTNTYGRQVTVTHFNAPATGSLDVNGQLFPITSSPQTVTLSGLPSNGQPVNVTAFFTDAPGCSRTENALFTAPPSCANVLLFGDSVQGAPASQVIVPIRVKQFNALVGAQGTVQWNTAIAAFDTVFQYGLPGLSPANFGLSQVSTGRMTFSWDDNTLQGVTLADSSIIFAIRFDVTGTQGQATPVLFVNTPTALEFTDNGFLPVAYTTIPGEIRIPITGCVITNLQAGLQSSCNPADNTFSQQVTVTYSNAPATGSLVVNGQGFPITSSPQTVTLTGLNSTGQPVDVTAFFSDDPSCTVTATSLFNAPPTCADFRIFADSVQGSTGGQVIVPVRVENFISLVSAQGSIHWDTSVATFDTVFQYGLPNMAPSNFGLGSVVAGRLSFSWDDSTFAGVTVPDSAIIFGIRFNVVGTQGMRTPVRFRNTPTALEFTDANLNVIAYDTTAGEIEIPITSCVVLDLSAGFTFPCDSAGNTFGQELFVTYANAPATGNLVVNGQSFPITGSPQTVILTGLPATGAPVDVSAFFSDDSSCVRTETGLFTAPSPCGTFIIFGDSVQGATGTQVIVPVRARNFDRIVGIQGTIHWDIAVATYDTVFQYGLPGMNPSHFGTGMVNAGNLAFSWDDQTLQGVDLPDSSVLFAIRFNVVGGPGSVTPVQFLNGMTPLEFTDVNFNLLSYDTIPGEIEVPITGCAITDLQTGSQGACDSLTNTYTQQVVVIYQSDPGTGNLIVNGQSFPITGSPQTVTLTGLPANGLSVNTTAFFSADTACFRIEYALFTAPVNCLSTLLAIFGDSIIAASGSQAIVPIRVRNFIDIVGAQGTIQWNTAIATFDTVFQYGLPGMSPANFGLSQTASGLLAFSWDDASLQGVTVADSSQIFGIRFNVVGPIGTQTPVAFVNAPTVLEFTDKNFVVQPYDTIPGEIRIPIAEIHTDSLSNVFLCAGDTLQVTFSLSGIYNPGNVFSVELSDALGSFVSPTVIGSVTGTTAVPITVVIPYVPSGTGYRIRVVSSSPVAVGTDNGVDLTISNIQTVVNTAICEGDSILLGGAFQTLAGTFADTRVAANSCDSIVTTILSVIPPVRDTLTATICDGDSIFLGGAFQTLAGAYMDTLVAASTCDSIVTTLLNVQQLSRDTAVASICDGDSIFVGGGFQTLAGFYTDTLLSANGCDSLVTTDLTVIPAVLDTVLTSICDGDSAFAGGGFQYLSGTYQDTLVAASSCDSIVTTVLTVLPNFATSDTLSICAGDSAFLGGAFQTTSGTYVDTLVAANTCDSVVTTLLQVLTAINDTVTASLCAGDSLFVGGAFQTATGTYVDSLLASAGCDSVVTTLLTVFPVYNTNDTLSICEGDSAFLGGAFQLLSGSYVDTLASQNSCDSVVTTLLNVIAPIRDTVATSICDGDSVFLAGAFQSLPGTYTDTLVAASTCDSIVTTLLTVLPNSQTALSVSICDGDSIFVGGSFQSLSGVYTDTLVAANGCDSVVTTTLTVLPLSFTSLTASICDGDSFFVGGAFQTLSGVYADTLVAANSCDSIVTTTLTVLPNSQSSQNAEICDGDSIFLAGAFQTLPGVYTDTLVAANSCDSVVTTTLVVHPVFATNATMQICTGDSAFLGGAFQTQSGSYVDTLASQFGCDSVVTTLLNVVQSIRDTVSASICDGDSILVGGAFQTLAGAYSDTLLAGSGCDSIVTTLLTVLPNSQTALSVSICDGDSVFVGGSFQSLSGVYTDTLVAANGCDSVITTTLTVLPLSFTSLTASICDGDSFFVGGAFQTLSGVYADTLVAANSCDSIVTTTLTVLPNSQSSQNAEICDGDSIFLAGAFQTLPGVYTDTLVAANSCDSVVTTTLVVHPVFATNATMQICTGDSAFLGGAFQTQSGSYVDTLASQFGCDSVVTTLLNVVQSIRDTVSASICDGDSILVGGAFQTLAGAYSDTLLAGSGCDSIVTTLLTVLPNSQTALSVSICDGDSIFVGGSFQSLSGVYTDTLVAANGCDSVITTTLTVLPLSFTSLTASICDGDSFFVGGAFQTLSGVYADTLVAANNCDSIVTTTLTVLPNSQNTVNAAICDGDSIFVGGAWQFSAGVFTDTLSAANSCDSVVTTNLSILPVFATNDTLQICQGDSVFLGGAFQNASGSYVDTLQSQAACDSVVTTWLEVIPAVNGTDTVTICAGDSVFLEGAFQSSPGVYVDTLVAASTCDSIVATTLIVLANSASSQTASICDGDSILLGGAFQTLAGVYMDTLLSANGCDSVITTTLTVLPNSLTALSATICDGDSIFVGGAWQFVAGVYNDTLPAANGCDSVLATTLTVNPVFAVSLTAAICDGDSIFLGGAFQTLPGSYMDTLFTVNGCDSVITTVLTVHPVFSTTAAASICSGDSILLGGAYQTSSGVYVDTLATVQGCDSIISTTLSVLPSPSVTQNQAICAGDSIFLGGAWQTAAGTYVDVFTASNGCDSTVTSILTVNPLPQTPVISPLGALTFCAGDSIELTSSSPTGNTWSPGGQTTQSIFVNTAGQYTVTTTDANGCTSPPSNPAVVASQPLAVSNFSFNVNVLTVTFTDLSTGDPFSWTWDFGDGGSSTQQNPSHTYAASGTYTVCLTVDNGCGPSTNCQQVTVICPAPVANFTSSGNLSLMSFQDASTNGPTSWSWTFGDGGTSTLQNPTHVYGVAGTFQVCLTATNACGSNTVCNSVNVLVGITDETLPEGWTLYPNPNEGMFFLEGDRSAGKVLRITVVDLPGRILIERQPGDRGGRWQEAFDLSGFSQGVYILRVETTRGTWAKRIMRR